MGLLSKASAYLGKHPESSIFVFVSGYDESTQRNAYMSFTSREDGNVTQHLLDIQAERALPQTLRVEVSPPERDIYFGYATPRGPTSTVDDSVPKPWCWDTKTRHTLAPQMRSTYHEHQQMVEDALVVVDMNAISFYGSPEEIPADDIDGDTDKDYVPHVNRLLTAAQCNSPSEYYDSARNRAIVFSRLQKHIHRRQKKKYRR